jgi:hypothetical protein
LAIDTAPVVLAVTLVVLVIAVISPDPDVRFTVPAVSVAPLARMAPEPFAFRLIVPVVAEPVVILLFIAIVPLLPLDVASVMVLPVIGIIGVESAVSMITAGAVRERLEYVLVTVPPSSPTILEE